MKGEILNLHWEDIDFQRSIAIFRETKNGESRSVSLNPNLVALLRKERLKRPIFSYYVFPSKDGKRPTGISTAWENAVKLSGLKDCNHEIDLTIFVSDVNFLPSSESAEKGEYVASMSTHSGAQEKNEEDGIPF